MNSIRQAASYFQIKPLKELGQNFLTDTSVINSIVAHSHVQDKFIVEVGAGIGNMTKMILDAGAKHIFAIEFDQRCVEPLQVLQQQYSNLTVIVADALSFDYQDIIKEIQTKYSMGKDALKLNVVANLPYNIGTALVIRWLHMADLFDTIVVMLQKEVIERFAAVPGNRDYSSLSVFTNLMCHTEKLFDVPKESFWPVPKVTSSVMKMVIHTEMPSQGYIQRLESLLKIAFAHKRKTLRNNFKSRFGEKAEQILNLMHLSQNARAEELTLRQFQQLLEICSAL